jgi:ketosteroid isomerase-like protein
LEVGPVDAEQELMERWQGWQASIEARDVGAAGGFLADDYALELAHGDIGLVLHRAFQEAIVNGADRSGLFVLTDIWRRIDGTWRVWRRHSTPLTAGTMPGSR